MAQNCLSETLVDEARVRVTRFTFAPGAETGWHRHSHDYVIVALTACQMRLIDAQGAVRDVVVPAGDSYRRDAGVEHNVVNAGSEMMMFVEVELKEPAHSQGL